jgi:hypothetical protein
VSKSFFETVEGMVNKRNATRRGREYFNSFVLLNDKEFLRKNPEWKNPLAMCIYCAKIGQEQKFAKLFVDTFIPYNGSRRLRQGVCAECNQNTSKKTK